MLKLHVCQHFKKVLFSTNKFSLKPAINLLID